VNSTQVYEQWRQAAIEEGEQRGRKREEALVLRLLTRQVGMVPGSLVATIQGLSLTALEDLGEASLDFEGMDDLLAWLTAHRADRSSM
jgi:predicted transposase YdaD